MSDQDRGSLQQLMAGLAHELNTPLGAIQSNRDVLNRAVARISDILADGVVDDEEIEHVRSLAQTISEVIEIDQVAVDVIAQLVASVRNCWRPDEHEKRCVDLHRGIDSTLLLLRHELKNRIKVEKEYGKLPPVFCYPGQTNQVFMNLLLNASQAIEGEGKITIRTYEKDGHAAVEISDTGSGIESDSIDRIFDSGFTTKGTRSGMGLGLRICREIIERQGGAIEVESTVGKGSSFRVTLPLGGCEEVAGDL
ncbi:MAG: ATPase [Gemmatimonadetes bacterium]|uniref:histidine kinase n=1 Tax=Candidatus Kutchimonas denitrificans TaxID=3056748 RepID=A0AAE4Z6J0_9BACT|nr:ATPase [Gemmatimonadota bacterium]NIR74269.1 ATPase [Candidatus Kutchimonas denitrificans]NIS02524.1 ATPase [Gemmatimonadota bacterium]NIT68400.1 ATPase [Gemmatimonadota bacterium]NIU51852.1 ATPase [Gemmatimonadota bacterium]